MVTFVLVHSPYAGPSTWLAVADELRAAGHEAVTPSFAAVADAPGREWEPYLDVVASAVPSGTPATLVGHSGAGPLLPSIGQRLSGIVGYIFVDATLPVDGYRRANSVSAGERRALALALAHARGPAAEVPNPWRAPATWAFVGLRESAEALAAETPRISAALNEAPVTVPACWPDAPAAYLAFTPNAFYAPAMASARSNAWEVRELRGAHFHMLVDPAAVARALAELVAAFEPSVAGAAR